MGTSVVVLEPLWLNEPQHWGDIPYPSVTRHDLQKLWGDPQGLSDFELDSDWDCNRTEYMPMWYVDHKLL